MFPRPTRAARAAPAAALARLDAQRAAALAAVAGWPPARLAHRPAPGAWSAAEVLDHLARVEAGVLAAARRGIAAPRRRTLRDRLGFLFIERVFRSDRRVRVPAGAAAVLPDPGADPDAARARWAAAGAEWTAFVAALAPDQLRGGVFRHPVAGWMSVPQALSFLAAHAEHHCRQLARLAASAALAGV